MSHFVNETQRRHESRCFTVKRDFSKLLITTHPLKIVGTVSPKRMICQPYDNHSTQHHPQSSIALSLLAIRTFKPSPVPDSCNLFPSALLRAYPASNVLLGSDSVRLGTSYSLKRHLLHHIAAVKKCLRRNITSIIDTTAPSGPITTPPRPQRSLLTAPSSSM